MTRRLLTLCILTAATLLASCTTAPKVERLHVEGTALMNESGDTVELKGIYAKRKKKGVW